jgi:RNA polymerase sigma-70 factor (ECF subfamily)
MLNRTNQEWLDNLRGHQQSQAIEDLRSILVRGLRYSLSTRIQGELDVLVEDFVQDALIRIIDKIDTFRGESQFTTWAQKIAVRVAYSELRRQRWKDISLEDLLPEDSEGDFTPAILADGTPDPEQQTTQRDMFELVIRLINEELTAKQRQVMMAIMAGGMPLEEVARRMDTNRNALYKLLHDARKRLQLSLEAQGLTPEGILAVFENE